MVGRRQCRHRSALVGRRPKTMRSGAEELLAFSPDVIMVFADLALLGDHTRYLESTVVFVAVGNPVGGAVLLQASRALEATFARIRELRALDGGQMARGPKKKPHRMLTGRW